MVASASNSIDTFLLKRMREGNISSTTLVFTFFCDVVTQHGGEIWLGSIIRTLSPLGINERLTRTAVFRLVRDGWLESRKQGRRSFYHLSNTGQNYYRRAASRIYASNKPAWDGLWTVLFTSLVPEAKRAAMKRGLLWLGYGQMATGVYALPCDARPELYELLADLELDDSIVCMQAQADGSENLKKLVTSGWNLDELRQRYVTFNRQYFLANNLLQRTKEHSGQSLLLMRVLLIHEYRKILLSDPELPAAMLPVDWEGNTAQTLTSDIYRSVTTGSTQWVNREFPGESGSAKCDIDILKKRFPN
jgi:phenylacetic acid degradation operon negative regulatory protein